MLAGMKIEGVLVMHKCDNRPCVRPDHLFTGTPKDNMDDMIAKGRARHPRGQDHQFAKLTPQVAAEIRKATGSQRQIARVFGIGRTTVQNVRNGKAWIPEVTA